MIVAALALIAAAPQNDGDPPQVLKLDRIEAQLFYRGTGRLSADLLDPSNHFTAWNTIIGQGSAEEPADDLVVSARLFSLNRKEAFVARPIVVIVRNAKGKIVRSRTFKNILTSKAGTVVLPLWLNDVGCAGELRITALYDGAIKNSRVVLPCGE